MLALLSITFVNKCWIEGRTDQYYACANAVFTAIVKHDTTEAGLSEHRSIFDLQQADEIHARNFFTFALLYTVGVNAGKS